MSEFSSIFSVKSDRKLTLDELVRAIRFNIATEYKAVQLYTQLAESIDHELAAAVLIDVAREELVHAGEFLKLLTELAPDERKAYKEGYQEVQEMMEALEKKKGPASAPKGFSCSPKGPRQGFVNRTAELVPHPCPDGAENFGA